MKIPRTRMKSLSKVTRRQAYWYCWHTKSSDLLDQNSIFKHLNFLLHFDNLPNSNVLSSEKAFCQEHAQNQFLFRHAMMYFKLSCNIVQKKNNIYNFHYITLCFTDSSSPTIYLDKSWTIPRTRMKSLSKVTRRQHIHIFSPSQFSVCVSLPVPRRGGGGVLTF